MTTAQLDHLRAIDAHFDHLLATAAKRKPGEWTTMGIAHSNCLRLFSSNDYLGVIGNSDAEKRAIQNNAAFIASCPNNTEAGWRSTKAAIELLIIIAEAGIPMSCPTRHLLEEIIAEWPLETLKP